MEELSMQTPTPTNLAKYEPAALVAAVEAILVAAIAFGLDITTEQLAAVVAAMSAVGVLFVRNRTVTVAHLDDLEEQIAEEVEDAGAHS